MIAYSEDPVLKVLSQLYQYTGETTEKMPASWHQERLWLIDQLESGYLYEAAPVYHTIPLILDFTGELEIAALERSIDLIIKKYDILRTRIVSIEGRPFQEVLEADDDRFKMEVIIAESDECERGIDREIHTPFGPEKPLMRVRLFSSGGRRHTLLILLHHMIADSYSVRRLSDEIVKGYIARREVNDGGAKEAKTAEETKLLQYGGFSRWQQECLSAIEPHLLSYWRQYLAPPMKKLELPADRPLAANHTYMAGQLDFDLSPTRVNSAILYEQRTGITLKMLLMAVWNILLHKYSREEEIVLGTYISNREGDLEKNLIGPAGNLLVMRSRMVADISFDRYVKELQESYGNGLQFRDMPFDKLMIEMASETGMSRGAIFDVLFQYEEPYYPDTGDWKVDLREKNLGYGNYDLNLLLLRQNDHIVGKLTYNADTFDQGKMTSLTDRYLMLLDNLLSDPSKPIAEIDMLPETERRRLLNLFNKVDVGFPAEATLVTLFKAQAKRTPGKMAVKLDRREITYAELDRLSDKVALLLKAQGVKTDYLVLLLADRSIEMVIGILAILKAGGAYLPIDIDYPEERIRYIIADSQSAIMLTTKGLKIAPERVFNGAVLYLDEEDVLAGQPPGELIYEGSPSDLCYVIYTSGTTGNPKGVMIEHRNVVRLLFNDQFQFDFGADDVWTMFHSHSFDVSVWEIFGALLYGGKLIIIPKMAARDARLYLKILEKERVTIVCQTPSAFYNLIQTKTSMLIPFLMVKYLIFAGEALSPVKLKDWHDRHPEIKLINMYGITETTVHSTYKEIGEEEMISGSSNIGQPLPTVSMVVLDEYLRLVPEGIPGELFVGGEGVARGYWRREDLTLQRFILNPYDPAERLYRSGDLVRILDSGELEYAGRIDHQVKLRGFRIELGEIETHLAGHPGIKDIAVLLKEVNGENVLVAYYASVKEIEGAAFRSFLSARLPDYMIPSFFVHLDRLPLTSNGKLDKKSLVTPEIKKAANYQKPVNQIQTELVKIWSEVLDVDSDKIGISTNFFDLAGNSIKLVKLAYKINHHFNTNISVATLFKFPAISLIADFLTGERQVAAQPDRNTLDDALVQKVETIELLNRINSK